MCDDFEPYLSWGDAFIPRYPHGQDVRWADAGQAVIGEKGWVALAEARRAEGDGSSEGRLIQACVEIGLKPLRD